MVYVKKENAVYTVPDEDVPKWARAGYDVWDAKRKEYVPLVSPKESGGAKGKPARSGAGVAVNEPTSRAPEAPPAESVDLGDFLDIPEIAEPD